MKKLLILFIIILFAGCKNKSLVEPKYGASFDVESYLRDLKYPHLAEIYYKHGNFINTKHFPPIIQPKEVYAHLNDYLIIDLRSLDAYIDGHINGAYHVDKHKVLDFLKNKEKASAYDKVVFVCYSGQTASYVTGITRYAGFDNTYAMMFGMAGWNKNFADPLLKGFGDRYPEMIEKAAYETGVTNGHGATTKHFDLSKLPELPAQLPSILIEKQAGKLLGLKRPEFLLKADEFFPDLKANPDKYYTIFYMDKAKFYEAHIRGSHQFTPRKDLSLDGRLTEIPTRKPVLIYCKTGHTGGNAAAYLGMIGYDAKNLIFGVGSFMYSLWKEKGWMPDINVWINDYPFISGRKRLSGTIRNFQPDKKKATPVVKPATKRKKKAVSAGCG